MKYIFMTMAAVSALGLAAPAASQPWSGNRDQSQALQSRIDDGVRSGAISRREALPLRDSLRRLVRLEGQFGSNGYSGRENAMLSQRSAQLRRQIGMAERSGASGDRRAEWQGRDEDERGSRWDDRSRNRAGSSDRDEIERYARWNDGTADRKPLGREMSRFDDRFDRANSGDRFVGDVRVGQAASARMTALPEQYRARFADDERVYYRYDDRRIYQVDRRNGLVLGMLDLVG